MLTNSRKIAIAIFFILLFYTINIVSSQGNFIEICKLPNCASLCFIAGYVAKGQPSFGEEIIVFRNVDNDSVFSGKLVRIQILDFNNKRLVQDGYTLEINSTGKSLHFSNDWIRDNSQFWTKIQNKKFIQTGNLQNSKKVFVDVQFQLKLH